MSRIARKTGTFLRVVALGLACLVGARFARAIDAPHGPSCDDCHKTHSAPGGVLTKAAGNANLCQTCHSDTGAAQNTSLLDADQATPGTSGTSHRWDAVAINSTYETALPSNARMLLRIDKQGTPGDTSDDTLMCSTCHDQHNNDQGAPFLRISNAGNAMCNECHAARNVATSAGGSHPVGVAIPGAGDYQSPPNLDLDGGNVTCTSCHGVHFASSAASEKGTADSAGTTTALNDSTAAWTPGALVDWRVFILSGPNAFKTRVIAANTATQISWTDPLGNATANGDTYRVQDATGAGDGHLLRQAKASLCAECHTKPGNTAHADTTTGALWPGGQYGSTYPARPASVRGQCVNCHAPHGAPDDNPAGQDFATLALEENWSGAPGTDEEEDLCYTCHDGAPASNISLAFSRVSRHPVKDSEQVVNRSVECSDCHDVHLAQAGNHTQGSSLGGPVTYGAGGVYPANTQGGPLAWNAASGGGALPTVQANWSTVTLQGRTAQNWDGDFEAYTCFKCHTSYAPANPATDVARIFNPNNGRYHAVLGTSKASGEGTYLGGWTATSKMTCSDCHASSTAGDPAGPHGSADAKVLKGLWTSTTGKTGGITGHLCFSCHDSNVYAQGGSGGGATTGFSRGNKNYHTLHMKKGDVTGCGDCHGTIPHGWTRSYPLWTDTDPAPYSTGVTLKAGDVGNWGPTGDWRENDCSETHNVCG